MIDRWWKIETLIALLVGITIFTFFLTPFTVFRIFLWITIVTLLIKVLLIIKKSLWKIRNRLIFSALFFVVTPIFLIILFFWTVGNVIITQYGAVIMNNIMSSRLNAAENLADSFLLHNNSQLMSITLNLSMKIRPQYFNAIFWERRGDQFVPFLKHPTTFNDQKLIINEFKDFFIIDDRLYQGVLKTSETHAVLIAFEINQMYLDVLSDISDFRLRYRNPNIKVNQVLSDSSKSQNTSPEIEYKDIAFFTYEYTFLDFNSPENNRPLRRSGDFLLTSDMNKIYVKIKDGIIGAPQGNAKNVILALMVLFGTFIIISLFIGFRIVRVITRSINQLSRGTQRIRNGDFTFRIRTRTGDQLHYLAESFNEMASGIDRLLIDEKEKQRLEEELRIARSIQLKLLPAETFQTEEFEIAATNIPATEVAGDYFDYFYQEGKNLSLFVADVSGKGASAAFYMAELKGVINHLQQEFISPSLLISECHNSLVKSFDRMTFITMNMAQFCLDKKKFLFSRAGHTQAIFYDSNKDTCIELLPEGVAIGLINFSREKIKEIERPYKSGDILFLFSDGLSEIMNEDEEILGAEKLRQLIYENHHLSAIEMKKKILDFSINFSKAGIIRDDLTFIILKVK